MNTTKDITGVCCIESGFLEDQVIRMASSLRKFGGSFSDIPLIAVTPRPGPPLSRFTRRHLDELGVHHFRAKDTQEYDWFKFLNKPLALVHAEKFATTSTICWLDSDLLFVGEPQMLDLQVDEDLAAFPVECKEMGTSGQGDPYEPIWREFCKVLAIEIDDLPWVTTAETDERVRLYFNGGIFSYRRSTGFGEDYLRTCLKLLDARIKSGETGYSQGLKEMSSIGFAAERMGLRWRELPYSHDYVMSSATHHEWFSEERLRDAKVIHYHDSMWEPFWPIFLGCMKATHPQVAEWLLELGPMTNLAAAHHKAIGHLMNMMRKRAERVYSESCRIV